MEYFKIECSKVTLNKSTLSVEHYNGRSTRALVFLPIARKYIPYIVELEFFKNTVLY